MLEPNLQHTGTVEMRAQRQQSDKNIVSGSNVQHESNILLKFK